MRLMKLAVGKLELFSGEDLSTLPERAGLSQSDESKQTPEGKIAPKLRPRE